MEVELLRPTSGVRCRSLLHVLFGGVLALVVCAYGQSPGGVDEYRAKAALLFNVCKFVNWPAHAVPDKGRPFVIAVVGNRPMATVLSRELSDKSIGGRKVVVQGVRRLRDVKGVAVVYCTADQLRAAFRAGRARLAREGVMTVGDGSECIDNGGVLALGIKDEHLAFEVNIGAARRAGLEMNANLLRLATRVVDK